MRLLTDSPWAKQKTIRFTWTKPEDRPISYKDIPGADPNPTVKGGSPVGGIGAPKSKLPDKADIIIRWVSALPERHAKALYRQRDEKTDPRNVSDLIGPPEADYVLEISFVRPTPEKIESPVALLPPGGGQRLKHMILAFTKCFVTTNCRKSHLV